MVESKSPPSSLLDNLGVSDNLASPREEDTCRDVGVVDDAVKITWEAVRISSIG